MYLNCIPTTMDMQMLETPPFIGFTYCFIYYF